jgi:hypothetical protein
LIDYERAVLALPADVDEARLADALALHPLAPRDGCATWRASWPAWAPRAARYLTL